MLGKKKSFIAFQNLNKKDQTTKCFNHGSVHKHTTGFRSSVIITFSYLPCLNIQRFSGEERHRSLLELLSPLMLHSCLINYLP